MDFSSEEIYSLRMILNAEIEETKKLIKTSDSKDADELTKYLTIIENIYNKLK